VKLFWKTRRYIRVMYTQIMFTNWWRFLQRKALQLCSLHELQHHWLTDWLVCMFTHTVDGNRQRNPSVDNLTKTCHWFVISIWADLDTIVVVLHIPQWLQDSIQLKCVIFSVSMTPPGHNTTKIHVADAITRHGSTVWEHFH